MPTLRNSDKKSVCNGRGTFYCPKCQPKDSSKRVIGLTGGIASGKSFISGYLQSLGAEIIDADEIAREIMVPMGKYWRNSTKHSAAASSMMTGL